MQPDNTSPIAIATVGGTDLPAATPVATSATATSGKTNDEQTVKAQHLLRFHHEGGTPLAALSPYQIRQKLKDMIISIGAQFTEVAVTQSETATTLIALTPGASLALKTNSITVMQAMANLAGTLLEVNHDRFIPHVSNDKQVWMHQVTKMVVGKKKSPSWAEWRTPTLTESQITALEETIRTGLQTSLAAWGKPAEMGILKVIDAGRPMVISPSDGPHMLVRLGVKFITSFPIEGALFVGPYNYLGMGRVMRIASLHNNT